MKRTKSVQKELEIKENNPLTTENKQLKEKLKGEEKNER